MSEEKFCLAHRRSSNHSSGASTSMNLAIQNVASENKNVDAYRQILQKNNLTSHSSAEKEHENADEAGSVGDGGVPQLENETKQQI